MIFNTTGGGGTPLNFKVVGSPTAPSNPKENTIWVKTSTPLPTNVSGYAWEMRKAGTPNWETYVGCTVFSYDSSYTGEVSKTDTAAFDIYAAKNPKRQIHALLTACYQNQDGTSSGWKKMNAYIYKSGSWVQFSAEFAATIAVTYPEGSTLTCSDGTTTLKATTTTGSYTFTVTNTGTWTVTCTDGTDTATDTVEITEDGQSASVELSYRLYLYKNGDECTAVTGGWTARGWKFEDNAAIVAAPTITKTNSYMGLSLSAVKTGAVEPANDIDLTRWNTLTVEYSDCVSPSGERIVLEVINRSNSSWGGTSQASVWFWEDWTKRSIDISEINGAWDVAICMGTWTSGNTQSVEIKEIYLE